MKNEIINVNGTDIECPYHSGQYYVAIRPICQALGIDHKSQFERIKSDEILKDAYSDTVYASDQMGRSQMMFCLQLKYVFGWLFAIDATKVNLNSKAIFMEYKKICYEILFDRFMKVEKELNELAPLIRKRKVLERKLKDNTDYMELMSIKAQEARLGKVRKLNTSVYLNRQIDLFNDDEG